MKLHLGCGEKYLDGYVNIDHPATEHTVMKVKADVYTDIRELSHPVDRSGAELPDSSVAEIRNHHVLEHFTRTDALRQLLKWRRWLTPDGRLMVETPDFGACAVAYAATFSRHRRFQLGRHMLGSQEAPWANHLDFWDAQKFRFVLGRLGFKNIHIRRFQNSVAQRYSPSGALDWFFNLLGGLLPERMYRRYGGHKLPNIVVTAEKDDRFVLDEVKTVRDILSQYLVGRESEKMLHVWLDNYQNGK